LHFFLFFFFPGLQVPKVLPATTTPPHTHTHTKKKKEGTFKLCFSLKKKKKKGTFKLCFSFSNLWCYYFVMHEDELAKSSSYKETNKKWK
jgi:hypothetical protein